MNIPTIFQKSVCKCGYMLKKKDMREIGVDISKELFFLRFTCPECEFDGKVQFSKYKKNVIDLCREVVGKVEEEDRNKAEMLFELYKENIAVSYTHLRAHET